MLTVRTPRCCLVHAPDVEGPMYDEPLELILAQRPDAVLISGQPTYLAEFRVKKEDLEVALRNLTKLAQNVPKLWSIIICYVRWNTVITSGQWGKLQKGLATDF